MINYNSLGYFLLGVAFVVCLQKGYARCRPPPATQLVSFPRSSPYLPPEMANFLLEVKKSFCKRFPEVPPEDPRPGAPRLRRLPFFLIYVWNRVYLRTDTKKLLQTVNKDPILRAFFEVPPQGITYTTYADFTSKELYIYWPMLIKDNIQDLYDKAIIKLQILAGDDHPFVSPLNLSKSIDFTSPGPEQVQDVFRALGPLTDVEHILKDPPNTKRSWSDYLKLYLLYLLWGFPSHDKFDDFLRSRTDIEALLGLQGKKVLSSTLFGYVRTLESCQQGVEAFHRLLDQLVSLTPVKAKLATKKVISELGMLHGVLGNDHLLNDYGARLHYNSTKGLYYIGRIGRIIVDVWSQVPLWGWVTTASQALAHELETFGTQVTAVLPRQVTSLLLLLDQGFQGVERLAALRRGFKTIKTFLITPAYQRNRPTPNIFRTERLAVERTIGHLAVHLDLEHPQQLGETAALAWELGAIYIMQQIALYNHTYHPELAKTAITYLQR